MKILLGLLLMLLGLAVGLYVGVWVCLVGGIIQVIEALKPWPDVAALAIAWGVVRILLASAAGYLSAIMFMMPAMALLKD